MEGEEGVREFAAATERSTISRWSYSSIISSCTGRYILTVEYDVVCDVEGDSLGTLDGLCLIGSNKKHNANDVWDENERVYWKERDGEKYSARKQ